MSGTRLPAGAVGLANTATCGQNAPAVGPGGNIRHCPQCGSVFWGHFCHMLPDWEALMAARARRRAQESRPGPLPPLAAAPILAAPGTARPGRDEPTPAGAR